MHQMKTPAIEYQTASRRMYGFTEEMEMSVTLIETRNQPIQFGLRAVR